MKIKVTERSGEVGKMGETLNFSVVLNLEDPDFLKQYQREREKTYKKYLEMKRRIIKKWIKRS